MSFRKKPKQTAFVDEEAASMRVRMLAQRTKDALKDGGDSKSDLDLSRSHCL